MAPLLFDQELHPHSVFSLVNLYSTMPDGLVDGSLREARGPDREGSASAVISIRFIGVSELFLFRT